MDCLSRRLSLSLLFLLQILVVRPTRAQVPEEGPTSIGFSNPYSTQAVRAYRLPTWHWSTWTLSANGRAHRRSVDRELSTGESESTRYRTGVSLRPAYRSLWEGEERTASLRVSPGLTLNRRGTERYSSNTSDREFDRRTDVVVLPARGALREYVRNQTFLFVKGQGQFRYDRLHTEGVGQTEDSETSIGSELALNARFGVGVGRVRVVTPVIRALRVRERLSAVAPGKTMSPNQVQTAAHQLARRPGYQAVYDRPDKFFWRDFFSQVGLGSPSTFDLFYVADVLREPVGLRREGAELQFGPLGSYEYQLRRHEEDGQLENRDRRIQRGLEGFAEGRWYHNVTHRHQFGVEANVDYTYFMESRGRLGQAATADQKIDLGAVGQWLWVVADRVRLDTRLVSNLSYVEGLRGQEGFQPRNRYFVTSDLVVFVENHLSLTVGATAVYRHNGLISPGRRSEWDTGVQFQIDYVLSRALE